MPLPSLQDIPQGVADYWNIPLISAQTFLSLIVISSVLGFVFIVTRGRGGLTVPAVFFVFVQVFLVSIGWLDAWTMILTVLIVVLGVAKLGSNLVGG